MLDGTLSLQATSESNYAGIAAYVRNADDALFATGATQAAAVLGTLGWFMRKAPLELKRQVFTEILASLS